MLSFVWCNVWLSFFVERFSLICVIVRRLFCRVLVLIILGLMWCESSVFVSNDVLFD